MTMCEDLASYLATQLTMTVNTNIFCHYMPDSSGTVICLYQYGGDEIDKVAPIEYPQLQVKARASTPKAALDKLDDVRGALHTLADQTIGSTRYLYASASSSPAYLGIQKLDRGQTHLFTMNFSVVKAVE